MRNPTILAFWTLLAYALWLSAISTVPSSIPTATAGTDLDKTRLVMAAVTGLKPKATYLLQISPEDVNFPLTCYEHYSIR